MEAVGAGVAAEVDLTPHVAGADEFLVRVRLSGPGAGLESAAIETNTQINRKSLPRLSRGANAVQLVAGQQAETIQFRPNVTGGTHAATVADQKSVDVEKDTGYYKPTLRPAEVNVAGHTTWKLVTPTPIVGVTYGGTVCVKHPKDRVAFKPSWDGTSFVQDYEKTTDAPPYDLMVNRTVADVPAGATAAYPRYEFQTPARARSHSGPGIQYAAMTVKHEPKLKGFTPVGRAGHDQVFSPPADFLPWEHDDSPEFASLPAGGRLAYAYRVAFDRPVSARYLRVTSTRRKGWGTVLSEIQAFDAVKVDRQLPPAVVLPKLRE